jgi:hypothetical protein
MIISIVLFSIAFTYLGETVANTKKQEEVYLKAAKNIEQQNKIFRVLTMDFAQMIGNPKITSDKRFDIVVLNSKNSLYGIIEPTITYYVSKKDETLVRVESISEIPFDKKSEIQELFIFSDLMVKNMQNFKLGRQDGIVNLLFRAKDYKPMLLAIPSI